MGAGGGAALVEVVGTGGGAALVVLVGAATVVLLEVVPAGKAAAMPTKRRVNHFMLREDRCD